MRGVGVEQRADLVQRVDDVLIPATSHDVPPARRGSRPKIVRIVVVFPAPLGPRKPVTCPGRTTKLRSSTAVTGPKRLVRRATSIEPTPTGLLGGAGRTILGELPRPSLSVGHSAGDAARF